MRDVFEKFVPASFHEMIVCLEVWVEEQDIVEKARIACLASMQKHMLEQLPGCDKLAKFNLSEIEIRFERHSFMFQHGGLCVPHIMTEFSLFIEIPMDNAGSQSRRRQILGTFRYGTRLDGKAMSDYLMLFEENL